MALKAVTKSLEDVLCIALRMVVVFGASSTAVHVLRLAKCNSVVLMAEEPEARIKGIRQALNLNLITMN